MNARSIFFLVVLFFTFKINAAPDLRPLSPDLSTIQNDLSLILQKAKLENKIDFTYFTSETNYSEVQCTNEKIIINVYGNTSWSQTFYMTLQRIGFYFPHPRIQISPRLNEITRFCKQKFYWKPALKYAGFHFHTLHGSEWVHGFLMGQTPIANDTVRWLARNQQNIFDFVLLQDDLENIIQNTKEPLALAKKFGIHAGVVMGMALNQQRIYKLIPLYAIFSDWLSLHF